MKRPLPHLRTRVGRRLSSLTPSATLSGHVLDVDGAALSGASVTATNLETNQRQIIREDRRAA